MTEGQNGSKCLRSPTTASPSTDGMIGGGVHFRIEFLDASAP